MDQRNACVGRTISLQVIAAGYDATFIGGGAEVPMFVNLPGEHLDGVYCANEYLHGAGLFSGRTRESIVAPIVPGEAVVVLGGGNVAMDAVRTARRLGAKRAVVAYRRSRDEMPCGTRRSRTRSRNRWSSCSSPLPAAILGDAHDRVCGVKLQRMKLGEPDESGRRRPGPRDATARSSCLGDTVVMAIGTIADPLLTAALPGLEIDRRGQIEVGEDRATSLPGIYAGGDIVRGAGTVIRAMGDGKVAAHSIDAYLKNKSHAKAQMAAAAALAASRRG